MTEAQERRAAPRYATDPQIFASIDGQTVRVSDISQLGLAIHGNGLAIGSSHLLEINLSHRHVALSIEILDSSGTDTLHARFVDTADDIRDAIGDYLDNLD